MDFTKSEIAEIQTWSHFNNKVIKFQNTVNSEIFKQLFNDDWKRLRIHFIEDCNRDLNKFRTYLTNNQNNDVLIYVVRIKS